MHPWFSTASGNIVYAMNQMLVQSRGDGILIAPAVPDTWKDYAFKLACHGDLVMETAVKGGRLVKLTLMPGDAKVESERTLVLHEGLLDGVTLNKSIVSNVTKHDGVCRIAVQFKGPADVVTGSN